MQLPRKIIAPFLPRWRVRLTMRNGKLMHSGQKLPVKIKRTERGVHIGCTFISHEAIAYLREQFHI